MMLRSPHHITTTLQLRTPRPKSAASSLSAPYMHARDAPPAMPERTTSKPDEPQPHTAAPEQDRGKHCTPPPSTHPHARKHAFEARAHTCSDALSPTSTTRVETQRARAWRGPRPASSDPALFGVWHPALLGHRKLHFWDTENFLIAGRARYCAISMKHQVVPSLFVIRHPHPPRALACVSVYILVRLDAGWRMADGILWKMRSISHPEEPSHEHGKRKSESAAPSAGAWRMPDGT